MGEGGAKGNSTQVFECVVDWLVIGADNPLSGQYRHRQILLEMMQMLAEPRASNSSP